MVTFEENKLITLNFLNNNLTFFYGTFSHILIIYLYDNIANFDLENIFRYYYYYKLLNKYNRYVKGITITKYYKYLIPVFSV